MKKVEFSFNRIEKKYIINEFQYSFFLAAMGDALIPDNYPKYSLRNIYYDTPDDFLIRTSIEGSSYKEKLRLRSYESPKPDSTVFLEIKKKCCGVVGKRRISLSYTEAIDYLEKGIRPNTLGKEQIFSEIDSLVNLRRPIPKQYIYYEREAYTFAGNPDVRITFDKNITGRRDSLSLDGENTGERLLKDGLRLMEIKVPNSIPYEMASYLSRLQIYPTTFSKYGMFYKKSITSLESEVLQCFRAFSRQQPTAQSPSPLPLHCIAQ